MCKLDGSVAGRADTQLPSGNSCRPAYSASAFCNRWECLDAGVVPCVHWCYGLEVVKKCNKSNDQIGNLWSFSGCRALDSPKGCL